MAGRREQQVLIPLELASPFYDRRVWGFVWPVLLFVLVYSLLPHKELRFVIYAVPVCNIGAAAALSRLHYKAFNVPAVSPGGNALEAQNRYPRSELGSTGGYGPASFKAWLVTCWLLLAAGAAASSVFMYASVLNYPGTPCPLSAHEYLHASRFAC